MGCDGRSWPTANPGSTRVSSGTVRSPRPASRGLVGPAPRVGAHRASEHGEEREPDSVETDTWLTWHVQLWRIAREQVTKLLGRTPSATIVACAVSGIWRLANCSACSVDGRAFRWRSGADTATLKDLAGSQLGPWARGRTGRPKLRREEPLVRSVGIEWWRSAIEWRPRDLALSIAQFLMP